MQKGTLIGTEQRLGHFAYLLEESGFKHQVQQVLFLTSFNYDLLARILLLYIVLVQNMIDISLMR